MGAGSYKGRGASEGARAEAAKRAADWAPLIIPALLVHRASAQEITVTVPVLPYWRSTSLLGRASGDCSLVVRDLLVHTHAAMALGPRDVHCRVRAHKNEEVFLGNALFKVKSCASGRPALMLEERMEEADEWSPVVYGYVVMGLPRQHAEQQTLLF